jgi:hypothetical protein
MSEALAANPYWQITCTYLRRKMLWFSFGFLVLIFIPSAWEALHQRSLQRPGPADLALISSDPALRAQVVQQYERKAEQNATGSRMILFAQAWILWSLLAHVKEQIGAPRAVLVPNFRTPHLVIAGAFAAVPLVIVPLGISAAYGLPPLAVLATGIAFSALVLWSLYLPRWPWVTLLIVLWFGSLLEVGTHYFYIELANTATIADVLAMALGLAAIGGLGVRLMRLREEMPEYARQIASNRWQTMTMAQMPQSPGQPNTYDKPMTRLMYAGARRRLASLAAAAPSSARARLERWRLAGNPTSLQWIIAPIFLLEILIMTRTTGEFNAQFMLIQLVGFPTMFFPQFALGTWPTLGVESLRPVTRAAYLRQRGGTFALQLGQVWVILAATLVTCAAVFQPGTLASAQFWISLAVTALAQFPLFAVSVWVLRLRWPLATVGATSVFAGLGFAGSAWCHDSRMAPPAAWVAAILGAVLLVSVIILRDAYRRWMQTDLA